jgi:hypothetical protein
VSTLERNCLARQSNHRKSWEGGLRSFSEVSILLVHVGMSRAFLMMRGREDAVALEFDVMSPVLPVLQWYSLILSVANVHLTTLL